DPISIAKPDISKIAERDNIALARTLTAIENEHKGIVSFDNGRILDEKGEEIPKPEKTPALVGITGTGGAGKSSLTDELVRRFLNEYEDISIGIISVAPSKIKTGGALLGDRIRMNSIDT